MGWILNVGRAASGKITEAALREERLLRSAMRVIAAPARAMTLRLSGRRKSWRGEADGGERRLCIYGSFDAGSRVDDYVFGYLEGLREAGCAIDFVTGSAKLRPQDLQKLKSLCRHIHRRENSGRDFGHFKYGLSLAGPLDRFEEVVLANDSVYGPLFPLNDLFEEMSGHEADFWGISDSWDVNYHIHSYFAVFRKSCFSSPAFKEFWRTFRYRDDKRYVIHQGEIRLTQFLMHRGFRPAVKISYEELIDDALSRDLHQTTIGLAFADAAADLEVKERLLESVDPQTGRLLLETPVNAAPPPDEAGGSTGTTEVKDASETAEKRWRADLARLRERRLVQTERLRVLQEIRRSPHNSMHYFWREVIEHHRCPFIKIELIRHNPANVPNLQDWRRVLRAVSSYDVNLILRHQMRIGSGRVP